MKLVIKNGAFTKNTPADTKDSILLSLKKDYIDGIEFNINMTNDGEIIVYKSNCIGNNDNHKIIDMNLYDLYKFNLGSKVKKHYILKLEEVIRILNRHNHMLFLNMDDHGKYNREFVEKVVGVLKNYSKEDIYIKSCTKEIVLELRDSDSSLKVGAVIDDNDNFFWNLDLNFYCLSANKLKNNGLVEKIKEKKKNGSFIYVEADNSSFSDKTIMNVVDQIEDKLVISTTNVEPFSNNK